LPFSRLKRRRIKWNKFAWRVNVREDSCVKN
jgi:hypothetical protein